jgi:thiamine biosynthesis lipoprotein
MGMPITIDLVDPHADAASVDEVFEYLTQIDARFSTYKEESEISRINRGELPEAAYSSEMKEVFALAEAMRKDTNGYFDITRPDGTLDPSGVVKGWALKHAAALLMKRGNTNFMLDGAGDIATEGKNGEGGEWAIGIRNPFVHEEIVKIIHPHGKGVATSGSAVRGAHIYDPHQPEKQLDEVVSVTVLAEDVLAADLYATAAFAMGRAGIDFLNERPGLEGYAIDTDGIAVMTSGFLEYIA